MKLQFSTERFQHVFARGLRRMDLRQAWHRLLVALFIDKHALHTLWHCHSRPERSFKSRARQFHICARCTGLCSGALLSPVLLPWAQHVTPCFAAALGVLALDGTTQSMGWRVSNNALRLTSGLALGLTTLPYLLAQGAGLCLKLKH